MGLPLGPLGLAASLIGTGVSALGAINSAKAQAANASYQAQVAKNNQTIADQNAQYASQAGAAATTQAALKQRAQTAEVASEEAANGIDINSGSPRQVIASENELGQLNTATTAQNAALNVYGYKTQSTNFGAEATLQQQVASQAPTAGLISAGGTLLSGAGSLASKWANWQQNNGTTTPDTGTGGLY